MQGIEVAGKIIVTILAATLLIGSLIICAFRSRSSGPSRVTPIAFGIVAFVVGVPGGYLGVLATAVEMGLVAGVVFVAFLGLATLLAIRGTEFRRRPGLLELTFGALAGGVFGLVVAMTI